MSVRQVTVTVGARVGIERHCVACGTTWQFTVESSASHSGMYGNRGPRTFGLKDVAADNAEKKGFFLHHLCPFCGDISRESVSTFLTNGYPLGIYWLFARHVDFCRSLSFLAGFVTVILAIGVLAAMGSLEGALSDRAVNLLPFGVGFAVLSCAGVIEWLTTKLSNGMIAASFLALAMIALIAVPADSRAYVALASAMPIVSLPYLIVYRRLRASLARKRVAVTLDAMSDDRLHVVLKTLIRPKGSLYVSWAAVRTLLLLSRSESVPPGPVEVGHQVAITRRRTATQAAQDGGPIAQYQYATEEYVQWWWDQPTESWKM